MICRRHLPVARARRNFVCARSCGLGMEGCNRYPHGFPIPSTTVAVTDDGDVTSSCRQVATSGLGARGFCVSQAAIVEFSQHRMWIKSVGQMQVLRGRGGERERHFSLCPTTKDPTWTTQATRMGAENSVMRECDTARVCCPPTEELMSKKAPSFRGLDTSSDLFLVPKKNIIELLDIALCVRGCTRVASAAKRSFRATPPSETVTRKSCRE